jgi:hypothetical protein
VRVLRAIAVTVFISLLTLEGAGYISPLYYQTVVALSSSPGWSTPRFVAVWCLELTAWAIAAVAVATLLRSRGWYWWTLCLGTIGALMEGPIAIFVVGSHRVTFKDNALMYCHSLLPLVGAALGTAIWFYVHRATGWPRNNRFGRSRVASSVSQGGSR